MGHGGTRRDMVRHHETLTCAMRAPGVPAASTQGRQDSARFRKLSMILVDYYRILKIIIDDIDVYIHIYIHLQIQLSKASAGFWNANNLLCFHQKNCRLREKKLALSPIRKHIYRKKQKNKSGPSVNSMYGAIKLLTTPISRKPKCCIISRIVFKPFKDLWKLTTRSGENMEKSQIIQELYLQNCGSRDISWSIQITCFVYAVFCAMLCRFSTFLWRFNRFTPFLFLPFWKKTRLGTLDDLHRCWRRNMSTQSFTGGCVCDSTKRFPHCGIYTIHNCSLLP